MRIYREDFDNGPAGWLTWLNNTDGAGQAEAAAGALIARLPCWVDYLHAPPGAGYLHILFFLHTAIHPPFPGRWLELGAGNPFLAGKFPTDFRNALLRLRVRGQLEAKGARLVLHIQSKAGEKYVNFALTRQPIRITPEWSEQTLHLRPDPAEWTCLGARHDREWLGTGEIEPVLAGVNRDIHFSLFPLDIAPAAPIDGDPHLLKAGEDYPVDESRLPRGTVEMDWVEIRFPE